MKTKIQQFTDLLLGMTEKELTTRYKNTVFGFLWVIINPLIQMLVIGFIFRFFIKEPIEYYYYYLFVGLMVWNFFSLSVSKATPSIVYERGLIKKARFPRSVIPLSIIFSNFVHLLIALGLFTIPIIFLHTLSLVSIFYIVLSFTLLLVFTIGLSLFTSAMNVRYRDVSFFIQAFLMVWFYLNPIVYTLSMIPYNYYWLWRINPLTSILQLLQHGFLNKPLPGVAMLLTNIFIVLCVFAIGIYVFIKESKNFDDWL